ncbi:hypothetical protein AALP_AA5G172900 [Arabis alpina]|uniref:Uncharacterized protein n=1 Tax=Arabis alpina TaxID=50452 RepID=A0A087GXP5_ARAAL|nr:hypothetical protein AALP_AA5G172900 [Arabis alpina]
MEPTCLIDDDAEFWLPPEFLTDDDFLLEKENNGGGNENRHGFVSTVKSNGDDEDFLAGLTKQMVQSTLEDDFSGGFCGYDAFPARNDDKVWGTNRSPQSTLCGAGIRRGYRSNQNCQSRVSSQAAWDLYCDAAEEMGRLNINDGCNNHSGRGLLCTPTKLSSVAVTAAKIPNNGTGYYNNHQSLQYQKLQAIQFEQLKQQQLMKLRHHRLLVQQSRAGLKNGGHVNLSSPAWSYQVPRREIGGSAMRAVFIGDHAGKRGSTGTGVFLPQPNTSRTYTRKKPTLTAILVPARLTQVVLSNNDALRQRSNSGGFMGQMRTEQAVNEPSLPPDWDY